MSSRAISGRPGGGKSFFAVKLLLRELFDTSRPIVTNLPLRLDNILKYCLSRGRDDIDVYSRIQILDDSNVVEFWRYRGNGVELLPSLSNEEYKAGKRPAFELVQPGGVCYFLDEVHDFLNARNWQKTGDAILYYITKHRHLGDDVWWITQAVKNVDSQFRSVTQDYTYCRNFAKEKYRGFVKGKYFTATTFLQPLTWDQLRLNPDFQSQEKFTMDPEIASCYYTSKQGLAADSNEKRKGISVYWLFGGIAALVLVLFLVAARGPQVLTYALTMGRGVKPPEKDFHNAPAAVGSAPAAPSPTRPFGAPLDTPQLQKKDDAVTILAVPLTSISATEAIDMLSSSSGRQLPQGVQVYPAPSGSGVVVYSTSLQNASAISETIKTLDSQSSKTIVVRAVVLRRSSGRSSSVGIWDSLTSVVRDGGFGLGNISYDVASGVMSFGSITAAQEVLRILSSQVVRKYGFLVESRPQLAMSSGQRSEFASGREVPIPVSVQNAVNSQSSIEYKKVQFLLSVQASRMPSGKIVLDVEQSNDDVIGSASVGGNAVPTIATQRVKTRLELLEGQLAILGGVEVETSGDDSRAVPLIGQVPGLGLLFGSRDKSSERSELVVALTAFSQDSNPVEIRKAIALKVPPKKGKR